MYTVITKFERPDASIPYYIDTNPQLKAEFRTFVENCFNFAILTTESLLLLKIKSESFGHFFLSTLFNSQFRSVSNPGVTLKAINDSSKAILASFPRKKESNFSFLTL